VFIIDPKLDLLDPKLDLSWDQWKGIDPPYFNTQAANLSWFWAANEKKLITVCFSGCQNLEIWWPFLFKGLIVGMSSYFGGDSTTTHKAETDLPRRSVFQWLPTSINRWPFLFKGLTVGTSCYFVADSATKKKTARPGWAHCRTLTPLNLLNPLNPLKIKWSTPPGWVQCRIQNPLNPLNPVIPWK
jgi:hypothetical protein